ncbi:hypothetical protein [Halalkalibacter krulwichiae]|uniref:Uncharacterized protein n=2 Tax=Halalkalibacter krulwichiae TaxID=199441 RepID=A0A1X9MGX1_9BACI|nr:hypothetical protein [Halalkalibacter krulwichiae]ARK31874.1 hypothetical protein BkAM31D_19655 [Halalkalibacter krulwichiae]
MSFDWTIFLSVAGAFGAAGTAQYLSHRLTEKREVDKFLKEKYQNLYSPLTFKIVNYIYTESDYRKGVNMGWKPDPDSLLEALMGLLEKNINYINIKLLGIYEEYKFSELNFKLKMEQGKKATKDPYQASQEFYARLAVFDEVLHEYIDLSEKLGVNINKDKVYGVLSIIKLYKFLEDFCFGSTAKFLFENAMHVNNDTLGERSGLLKITEVEMKTRSIEEYAKKHTGEFSQDCYKYMFELLYEIDELLSWTYDKFNKKLKDHVEEDLGFICWRLHKNINADALLKPFK